MGDGPAQATTVLRQESQGARLPFEHYDYIVVLFRDVLDWAQAVERFGLGREATTLKDGERRKIGRGRVIEGARFLNELREK